MKVAPITDEQVDAARELVAEGFSLREAGRKVGASHSGIHRRLNPEFRLQANERAVSAYHGSTGVTADVDRARNQIPEDVRAERKRATSSTRSLTAEILGDPRPGRSALDKQRMNLAAKLVPDSDDQAGLPPS